MNKLMVGVGFGCVLLCEVVGMYAKQSSPKTDTEVSIPGIKSMSVFKELPDGSELGIIDVAGQPYFVVRNKGGDRDSLPEIVQRIDCTKVDKNGYFVGKNPRWEASCRSEDGKAHDPILVFHAGGE